MRKIVLIVLGLLSGCAKVGMTRLGSMNYPPRSSDCNIEVYRSASEITKPYKEICMVDSRTGTTALDDRSVQAAIEQAKPRACECGGDAMIIDSAETKGASLTGWGMGSSMLRVVKYTDK